MREKKGITLIALVVTIIVLLILAGVTLALVSGENGIIAKAIQARRVHIKAEMKEELELAINELQLEKEGKATLDDITQEWADYTLEDYSPLITSSTSTNEKKVTMQKSDVTGKFIIDEKLNITEVDETVKERLYLIKDGVTNEELIGEWEGVPYYGRETGSLVPDDGRLQYNGSDATTVYRKATKNSINYNGYNRIKMEAMVYQTLSGYNQYGSICVGLTRIKNNYVDSPPNIVATRNSLPKCWRTY